MSRIEGCNTHIEKNPNNTYSSTFTDRVYSTEHDFAEFVQQGYDPSVLEWCPLVSKDSGVYIMLSTPDKNLQYYRVKYVSSNKHGKLIMDFEGAIDDFFSSDLQCNRWNTTKCPLYNKNTSEDKIE